MNADPERWAEYPVVAEFHQQWWRSRGRRVGGSRLPFTRDWEDLLAEAGLTSAVLRAEAMRDVRELAAAGLLQIKPPPRRPGLVDRVRLPVAQEERLARLFGDPVGEAAVRLDFAAVDWEPELAFLAVERSTVAPEDLLALNRFLREGGRESSPAPVKERSVRIFGDEKRLDALMATALFGDGRLNLATLRAFVVPEPLGWRRGRGPTGRFLILENAATWDSFSRWNETAERYAAVIYGAGYRVIDGVPFLGEIAAETGGGIERIDYFGDLDPEGLRIPVVAGRRAQALGWPMFTPLEWGYEFLLSHGTPGRLADGRSAGDFAEWVGLELAERAAALFAWEHRIAQEWLGAEALRGMK